MKDSNRDLSRKATERGWAVYEPIFVFYGKDQPENIRDLLTIRAQEVGENLLALEFARTERAIDYLLTRPDLDPKKMGMLGVSYGGFNTLYTAALDSRILVAVVAAYFNDREEVLDASEPYGFFDWRFSGSLQAFKDPELAALICPRRLQVQAGTQDQLFAVEGARRAVPMVRDTYKKQGVEDRFSYHEFAGRHDLDGEAACRFMEEAFR